jgi:hypothetical protein
VTRGADCLSDLRLDELLRGELRPGTAETMQRHVAECAHCRLRLDRIAEARAAFQARPPALRGRRARAPVWVATGVLGAAGVLLLMLWPARPANERHKGGPQLTLYVRHADRVRPAGPRELVAPGDSLQFTYSSERARHLAVLSLDGAGHGTVYFPDAARAEPIDAGRDVPLPRSTVLDEVLGPESLFGLFCDAAIELEPVRQALERDQALPPLDACRVIQLAIEKRIP